MHSTPSQDCCVVGGGPAGMVLALLLARQGLNVTLLEAHDTFDRDFRGNSVHPSTQQMLDQLGLLDDLNKLTNVRGNDFPIHFPDGTISPPIPPRLHTRFNETMNVPQAAFLELLAGAARRYPSFQLVMGARVERLVEEDGVVRGVHYRVRDGWHEVRAALVVGADGRFSKVRQLSGIPLIDVTQEADILWVRLPKTDNDPPRAYGLYKGDGEAMVVSDRDNEWQIGLIIPKGAYQTLRRAGLDVVGHMLARLAPWLADRTDQLADWQQTSVLSVQVGHVRRWYRPGLLLIGDSAHVMSPVYGVGINYAIQDAIAAANRLGPRLLRGSVRERDLAAVQRRREWPTRLMQLFQEVEKYQELPVRPTRIARWVMPLAGLPPVRALRTRLIVYGGVTPERVQDRPSRSRSTFVRRAAAVLMAALADAGRSAGLAAYGYWPPYGGRAMDESRSPNSSARAATSTRERTPSLSSTR
jgi:2-polyprenyl-6-methoxyphenol hydroxylase-like FAD-dependent oxidoreductase